MRSMRAPLWVMLAVVLSVAGCKKNEPIPPTTPPPTESQVPAQPPSAAVPNTGTATPGTDVAAPSGLPSSSTDTASAPESTPSTTLAAAKAAPQAASGSQDGAVVYQGFCQTCHGVSGAGDGPAAAGLTQKPASFVTGNYRLDPDGNGTKGEPEDIDAVVRDGAAKYGGSPLMAPWPTLTAEQRAAVVKHVLSLRK